MEIRKNVKPVQVDMICQRCGRGMMRPDKTILPTYPPKYPHECNECGYTEAYYIIYPYIIWESDEKRD